MCGRDRRPARNGISRCMGVPMRPTGGPVRHAETAHILQPKDPRFPRRLPAAPGAVQGGVRPVVGGDRPSSRNLPPLTIRRWRYKGVRPNLAHQTALFDLADDLGLGHIFTDRSVQRETRHDLPGSAGSACRSERMLRPNAPTRCKVPGRRPARR